MRGNWGLLHCCGPPSVSLQSSAGLGRGWRCLGSTHQKLPPPPSPGTGHMQLDWLTRPVQTLLQFQACRLSSATASQHPTWNSHFGSQGIYSRRVGWFWGCGLGLANRRSLQASAVGWAECSRTGTAGSTLLPSSPGQPGLVLTPWWGEEVPGERGGCGLELAMLHFCHIFVAKASHTVSPDSRGGK